MKKEPKLHLNNFDGPLKLLLYLIHKNQMNIYNIQITVVTKQYVEELKKIPHLKLIFFGNFIVMATQLMYIKSQMLLPKPKRTSEDSDPRSGLVHRLVVYKKYRRAAKELSRLAIRRCQLHTRSVVVPSRIDHFIDLRNQLSVRVLQNVFREVVQRKLRCRPMHESITEWRYSVKVQSKLIINLLKRHDSVNFMLLFKGDELEELITNFLALLDLIKNHLVIVLKQSMQIKLVLLR